MVNRDLKQSLAIQLSLRSTGSEWRVDAVLQKDNLAKFTAACALPPK
jgi:hypothetical protein